MHYRLARPTAGDDIGVMPLRASHPAAFCSRPACCLLADGALLIWGIGIQASQKRRTALRTKVHQSQPACISARENGNLGA
jgi:hypothetical protein